MGMNLNPSTSLFAKLLAEENIQVRIEPTLHTAAFEPDTRTLMLPNLTKFDTDAWMLFVAHEVGHAKYTPQDALTRPAVQALEAQHGADRVRTVLNVLEDIRIERQIRVRYQGLAGVFARGYRSLVGQNFFGKSIDEIQQTHATMPLLDRLNLYGKIGALLHLTLVRPEDVRWYNAAARAETFEQILTIAQEILSAQEKQPSKASQPPKSSQGAPQQTGQAQQEQAQQEPGEPGEQGSQEQDQQAQGQGQQEPQAQPLSASSESQESASSPLSGETAEQTSSAEPGDMPSSSGGGSADDLTSETMRAAERFVERSRAFMSSERTVVLPATFDALRGNDYTLEDVLRGWTMPADAQAALCDIVRRQRKTAAPILASMVNTFRMYQSAWQSRREETSRSGSLDMTKLSQHKLVDDIFLRRTEVPNAKNHGLVLFVDWSGSMQNRLPTVLSQVLHLIWFAEQVGVPVEVYAFTDSATVKVNPSSSAYGSAPTAADIFLRYVESRQPSLVQYYRSDAPQSVRLSAQAYLLAEILERGNVGYTRNQYQYANQQGALSFLTEMPIAVRDAAEAVVTNPVFWRVRDAGAPYGIGMCLNMHVHRLGGTPLSRSVLVSTDYVRAFRAKHRVEQCVSVWLTDGEDGPGIPSCYSPSQVVRAKESYRSVGGWELPQPLRSDASPIVDPTFGRSYAPQASQFAQVLEAHRVRTGATVLVVDITDRPTDAYERVIRKDALRVFATDLQGDQSAVPARRRGRSLKPRVVKQTRRAVVLPSTKKTFPESGVFAIDRRDVPAMPCDAMLVSHPAWWMDQGTFDKRAVTRVLDDDTVLMSDDDDTYTSRMATMSRQVQLRTALLANSRATAMRKFADLIVPFIASGRDDATV